MTTDKKPMTLGEAIANVQERATTRGRLPLGSERMSEVINVRATPSRAARWRQATTAARRRSTNAFMGEAADLYAALLEALSPAALAAGTDPHDYVRDQLRNLITPP